MVMDVLHNRNMKQMVTVSYTLGMRQQSNLYTQGRSCVSWTSDSLVAVYQV